MQRPEEFVPVSLEPDPVIEYYKQFIDRSLLRENLKRELTQKLLVASFQLFYHDGCLCLGDTW